MTVLPFRIRGFPRAYQETGAGRHTFTAAPSAAGGPITWTVDREELSERGGGSPTRRNAIDAATGASATFDLPKIAGAETVYYITARDDGFQDTLRVQVFPADRRSSFHYTSAENPRVQVYLIVPSTLSPATRILMVMHGSSRNADDYCDSWVAWAPRNDYLILCPGFDDAGWPGARSYHLGNVFTGEDGAGDLNPESRWSFTVAEGIHATARAGFGIADEYWDMWGHSGGGQFTHRFLLFKPAAKIRFAMPANPGWYTAPDLATDYPYGLRHPFLAFMLPDLIGYTNKRMVIMRGTLDTERGPGLRMTPEADDQGPNRYERAGFMHRKGQELNPALSWELLDVEGAGHSQRDMAPAAQAFLEAPDNSDSSSIATAAPLGARRLAPSP